ncbi:MAG: hypothetical protein AAFQ12_13105 [Pseudomonadota bacterium]
MIRSFALSFAVLGAVGCQHAAENHEPAILSDESSEMLDAIEEQLSIATNKRGWRLDAAETSTSSLMTLRPPKPNPLNTNNPDRPLMLKLRHRAGECFAIRADTSEEIPLPDVPCKPA